MCTTCGCRGSPFRHRDHFSPRHVESKPPEWKANPFHQTTISSKGRTGSYHPTTNKQTTAAQNTNSIANHHRPKPEPKWNWMKAGAECWTKTFTTLPRVDLVSYKCQTGDRAFCLSANGQCCCGLTNSGSQNRFFLPPDGMPWKRWWEISNASSSI